MDCIQGVGSGWSGVDLTCRGMGRVVSDGSPKYCSSAYVRLPRQHRCVLEQRYVGTRQRYMLAHDTEIC